MSSAKNVNTDTIWTYLKTFFKKIDINLTIISWCSSAFDVSLEASRM